VDRIEKPPTRKSEFANQGEISQTDPAENDTVTGREDHMGLAEATPMLGSEIKKPVGAQPRSEITGRHDSGSGANETVDGLTKWRKIFVKPLKIRRALKEATSLKTSQSSIAPVCCLRFSRGTWWPPSGATDTTEDADMHFPTKAMILARCAYLGPREHSADSSRY